MPRINGGQIVLPIQEDETALVLWALGERDLDQACNQSLCARLYEPLVKKAAQFLVRFRDPITELPLPSFDLWEERFGVHTFTCAAVVAALRSASRIAMRLDMARDASEWKAVAERVDTAMDQYLFHRDYSRFARTAYRTSSGYHLDATLDASLAGLVTLNLRPHDTPSIANTIHQVYEGLRVPGPVGGCARYENDPFLRRLESAVGNPWLLTTFWVTEARLALGLASQEEARVAIDWSRRLERPSGVLPEQLDPTDGTPVGVAPLTWSHAARLSLLLALR
jgi:GH15 family glucan-1,4-alpha-glucosidase